jgi:enoyl-CoA hydratase/carnithine racemase
MPDAEPAAPRELVRLVRHGDHVAEIVLDRPEALNAVSTAMAVALTAVTAEVARTPWVRAVVLASAVPRAFCVGADLKERAGLRDDELRAQRPTTRGAYRSVLDLPVPVVAAVHGFALGGGFELALACDLVVADTTAVLGLPEVAVGIVPGGGGTQLLARRVGRARAADLVLTGRRVEAEEALALGCVDRLVPAGGAREAALALAATIAQNSPLAVREARSAMRRGLDVPLGEGLAIEDDAWHVVAFSPDRSEGVRAFAEGRRPVWQDAPGP